MKLKVLFVSSGNNKNFDIAPFIKEQGNALEKQGIDVDYFPIIGKGISGYIKAGLRLRKHLKKAPYHLIHAHFALSGWTAIIGAGGKLPVILSLMGSDAYGEYIGENKVTLKSRFSMLLTRLAQPFVKAIISKSENIERHVYLKKKSHIIPNGIDVQKFHPYERSAQPEQDSTISKRNILFLGDRTNIRKNYQLARDAVTQLKLPDVELMAPYPVSHHEIPKLLNETNVLVVPSLMEGSPNIVKEAMACNCPIVATDTGDVRWVFGDTEGCYLASFEVNNFADKIRLALNFSEKKGRTEGGKRIKKLGLDSDNIAKSIIDIYKKTLS